MSGSSKAFEDDDPFEMVAARFPVEPGVDADREMARCVVEEYALIGWSARRIRRLFDTPAYPALHAILARHGGASVDELIAAVFGTADRETG